MTVLGGRWVGTRVSCLFVCNSTSPNEWFFSNILHIFKDLKKKKKIFLAFVRKAFFNKKKFSSLIRAITFRIENQLYPSLWDIMKLCRQTLQNYCNGLSNVCVHGVSCTPEYQVIQIFMYIVTWILLHRTKICHI